MLGVNFRTCNRYVNTSTQAHRVLKHIVAMHAYFSTGSLICTHYNADLLDYIPITDTTTEEDVRNQIRSLLDVCQSSLLSAIQQDLPLNVLFGIRGAQSCSLPDDSEGYPRVTGVIRAYYESRGLRLPQWEGSTHLSFGAHWDAHVAAFERNACDFFYFQVSCFSYYWSYSKIDDETL